MFLHKYFFNQAEKTEGSNSIKDESLKNFGESSFNFALVYNNGVRFFAILPPGGDKCLVLSQTDNSQQFLK